MSLNPVDTAMAVQSALLDDPVRKKQAVDALRGRIGDSRSADDKLQEACEGFEAIFIQQIWEQMRKNVPKEGYLHSKDEETYQSLFDHELAKKMTDAGGIGLAAMLREQLGRNLHDASRGAVSGGLREPLAIATPRETLAASLARSLAMEDLYSPAAEEAPVPAPVVEVDPENVLRRALDELREEREAANAPDVLAAMAGPGVGRQAHFVTPGAETRIVANGPIRSAMPGRVSAPGREAPSSARMAPAPGSKAAGEDDPAPPARIE